MAHHFEARVRWEGSTAVGYEHYDRAHLAAAPPAEQELAVTTAEAKGDPSRLNPEQLVVMAASSCQLLWFLHLAAKARVHVVKYEDLAEAVMPDDWITEIALRPRIVVASDHTEERVRKLVEQAHAHCNIANSLRSELTIEPRIETRGAA